MYHESMMSVGKAENGYVVECRCKVKPEKKKDAKDLCCCYPGSSEKHYIAKDAKEVGELIAKLMPLLEEEYDSSKAFDSAFAEATGSMEMDSEMEDD